MTTRKHSQLADSPIVSRVAYDVVIVGGGMAGVMAAIAAKTSGNRVLVLEPSNVLGGQGTAGGVAGFCGDTVRVNAPFADLVSRLARHDLIEPYRPNDDRRAFDLEWCAFFLQEMVTERGVDVLFHARVIGAKAAGGQIDALTVSTVGGLIEITSRFVIDASGACVIPWLLGWPVEHQGANRQLPMSLYFTLWDTGKPVTPVLPAGCPRWQNDQEIPMTSLHRFPTGKIEVKMKVVGFDAADGFSLSAAEIFARRQMHGLIYYLQTIGYRGQKLATHVLAGVSRSIGVREERRIVGEHLLTEAEARRAVIFSDAVAVNTYHIDYHWPDRMERAGTGITDVLEPHHLPLSMMIPLGAKNLLCPGRGASGDQKAMSAYRVMAVVAQMGFAAGHAARQCVETGTDLAQLDISLLQAAIVAGGQSLNLSDYGDYLRQDRFAHEPIPSGPTGDSQFPAIIQGRNGKFVVCWSDPSGGVWLTARRETRWSDPVRLAQYPNFACARSRLTRTDQGGIQLRLLSVHGSVIAESVSADDGNTWSEFTRQSSLGPAADPTTGQLDDGTQIRFSVHPKNGTIRSEYSEDQGLTWSTPRTLEGQDGPCTAPNAVATRTGIALVFSGPTGQPIFWHGSSERLRHGPPQASAHELQLHA